MHGRDKRPQRAGVEPACTCCVGPGPGPLAAGTRNVQHGEGHPLIYDNAVKCWQPPCEWANLKPSWNRRCAMAMAGWLGLRDERERVFNYIILPQSI